MARHTCSNGELEARIVALESELKAFKELMDERDKRYKERSLSQDNAVKSALDTSEKAITKAETATEKRLEGLNELRQMATDQGKDFVRNDVITPKLASLDDLVKAQISRGAGVKDTWGNMVVAAGLLLTALAIYFHGH